MKWSCKHHGKAFVAARPNIEFDMPQCMNHSNIIMYTTEDDFILP